MGKEDERILVIERRHLEAAGLFQGLTFDLARYRSLIENPRLHRFLRRGDAEQDAAYKQIIPYFLIVHEGRFWSYTRGQKSGEERLVANISIGIGGHVNEEDVTLFGGAYETAARRELEEEVAVPAGSTDRMVALLNDDSNEVGRVHLGVVHVLHAAGEGVCKREAKLTATGFKTPAELEALRDRMETWSRICLDHWPALLERG
jgi:predicted NUDIX family phosphoesterase